MGSRSGWIRAALAACCALGATMAQADEIGLFGLTGVYTTNNGRQTDTDRRRDVVGWISFGTYGKWENNRLRTQWSLGEDGVKYFNGSFGAKNYTSGFLKLDYNALPDTMIWHLYDSTGQILITPAQPDTPLNRANFNVFSTGPSFHVPVTNTTWVGADALYTDTYYEKQTLNGDKYDLDLGLNKNLGIKSDLGAYVGGTEGTYKAFGNYRTENATLRYSGEGAFTKIKVQLGANRAVVPFRTGTRPSFDLDVDRTFRQTSHLIFKLQRKITTPSDAFAQIAGGYGPQPYHDGINAHDLPNTVSLYDTRLYRFSYETRRTINEYKFGLYYRKADTLPGSLFIDHPRVQGVDAMYHRIWGSKVGITVYGSFERHQGELGAFGDYREIAFGTEVARPIWTVATRWVLTAEIKRRTGDDPTLDYQEYRIGAYLRFSKFIFNRVK